MRNPPMYKTEENKSTGIVDPAIANPNITRIDPFIRSPILKPHLKQVFIEYESKFRYDS